MIIINSYDYDQHHWMISNDETPLFNGNITSTIFTGVNNHWKLWTSLLIRDYDKHYSTINDPYLIITELYGQPPKDLLAINSPHDQLVTGWSDT